MVNYYFRAMLKISQRVSDDTNVFEDISVNRLTINHKLIILRRPVDWKKNYRGAYTNKSYQFKQKDLIIGFWDIVE